MPDYVAHIIASGLLVVAQLTLWAQGTLPVKKEPRVGEVFWSQGLPYITSYTARDYKVSGQNWAVIQGDNGVMYVGNTNGILEFDGIRWKLIKTPGDSPVKSLARDTRGRIFCGGVNEVGFLEPDQTKGMVYRSLLPELDNASRRFGDIWVTHALGDTLYFVSDTHLMRWDGKQFRTWRENTFGFSWLGRGQLWFQIEGKGLHRMTPNGPQRVTEFDASFPQQSVTTGLAFGDDSWMLITSNNKGYRIENGGRTQADYFALPEGFVYRAARLRDGNYALACIDGGLYITTPDGHEIKHFTRRDGLTSNTILDVFVDASGDCWLAADKGIMRMEWDSPLRRFDSLLGIDEEVNDVAVFRDRVYAATTSGLYVLEDDLKERTRKVFVKVPRMEYLTTSLKVVGDHLIVGNYFGLFTIDAQGTLKRLYDQNVHVIGAANARKDYMLFATSTSVIGELIKDSKGWHCGPNTLPLNGRPMAIIRSERGEVLIGTRYDGIYKLAHENASGSPDAGFKLTDLSRIVHYDTTRGLPSMINRPMMFKSGTVLVPSGDALYRLDESRDAFVRYDPVMQHFQGQKDATVHLIGDAGDNRFWMIVNEGSAPTLYEFDAGLLKRVPAGDRFLAQRVESLFLIDGVSLFATSEGIVAFNGRPLADSIKFATTIRQVSAGNDSVVFAGHGKNAANPRIGYAFNNLSFQFALPDYGMTSANTYQYMLEGYDDDWSGWSTDAKATFTHLPEGRYTFRVRGRNAYGRVSQSDAWSFTVLPPWYRSWWAYVAYVMMLAAAVRMLMYWRFRRHEAEKGRLEQLVSERTKEVSIQAERLREMDLAKSRFYANISHEFRTPLTLIIAPLDELLAKAPDQTKWQMMRRNARRLLELVNQLLDLSKIDAGKMALRVRPGHLRGLLDVLTASFDSLADHRDMRFIKRVAISHDDVWFDADKMEKIAMNLLANAFKFTPVGGVVFFEAAIEHRATERMLVLTVSDNGRGISPDEQEQIFTPFYQSGNAHDGQVQGSGLGLSLVKELVELHHGSITVTSPAEGGSTFVVRLPVHAEAFSPDECVPATIDSPGSKAVDVSDAADLVHMIHEPGNSSFDPVYIDAVDARETVMVVEDNADLREFISSILMPLYKVIKARDGEEGHALTMQNVPDLVLTDLMMPRMDGKQLTEALKADERTCHIPVVLLTARNETAARIDGFRVGADDYLTKPFSAEELLVRVANLISLRKKLADAFRVRVLVEPTPQQHISLDDKFLFRLRDAVENRLSDPDFGVEQLAAEVCMSRTQLFRKLQSLAGISPSDFIRDIRLKHAAELIAAKADTVSQIGYRVGFRDQSYFTKCFKKQFGVAPSEFVSTAAR